MPDRPLLIFPQPGRAERVRRYGGASKVRLPDPRQQAQRLAPQFQRLQEAMQRQRLALQDNPLGLQPEQALVLETIGPIERFINAARRVGLEWLGEFELDEIAPEDGFEDAKDPEKELTGRLFLVMTDQQALHELQRLFAAWQQDPNVKFPRGVTPLKHAFTHLRRIRPWGAEDRIRETGILEDWQFRVEHDQGLVPFEAELFFRERQERREQAAVYLDRVIQALGGEVIHQCVIPDIAYHAILGRIPAAEISEILAERDVRLLQFEDIMHLRPIGQCAIDLDENLEDPDRFQGGRLELPQGEPVVALLDGLPLAGHRLLDGRLILDDPDGFETAYQAQERVHGTAMASLICHGDLDAEGGPLSRPVYARPIMQPRRGFSGQSNEAIPEAILPVDLVHRAVRRLYEHEDGQPPAAPSVRVINVSVCDRGRPFDRSMSSFARLLDWLAWKYNVLFVVSAGNHAHELELSVPRADLGALSEVDRERAVIQAIAANTRHRRLLAPAETLNGLTLGASHTDASGVVTTPHLIDPFARLGLPSTISAHGPGYRRAIKPDILLPGGRQLLAEKLGTAHVNAILQARGYLRPPGQRVAAAGAPGELDRTCHRRGTSNSAALASRAANFLYDLLEGLDSKPGAELVAESYTVLLKALLVHGADWLDGGALYQSILRNPRNSRIIKEHVGQFFGYGTANVAKVMACTDQRATILGTGELDDGEADEFLLPLPPSLSAATDKRRLTVTLAWLSPVNPQSQGYRIAHLWFDPKNGLASNRVCADYRAVLRGSVQHEVLEGDQAVDFQDGESVVIRVNCRADAGDIPEPIRYGLAVTLEVAEEVDVPIYQEVRERLHIRVPVRGDNTA